MPQLRKEKARMAIGSGPRVKTQPVAWCQCGTKLSIYRNKKETLCTACNRKALDAEIVRLRSKANQEPKKELILTPFQKEAKKALEEMGYEEMGYNKSVLWMEHPFAGRMSIHATPRNAGDQLQHLTQRARRRVSLTKAEAGEFIKFLRKRYNVPEDDSVVVQTTMNAEIRKWLANSNVQLQTKPDAVIRNLVNNEYVKVLKAGQGKNPSTIEIYGRHFIPSEKKQEPSQADIAEQVDATKDETPICGEQHPQYPAVWCTDTPGHVGMHTSEAVESGWYTAKDEPIVKPLDKLTDEEHLRKLDAEQETLGMPPVGVSTQEPQVANVTSSLPLEKTPQAGEQSAEVILQAVRNLLAPGATANEQAIAQCKDTVKRLHEQLDSAYDTLYALERILGI